MEEWQQNHKYARLFEKQEEEMERYKYLNVGTVFIVQHKESLIVYGCFTSRERAERFIVNSDRFGILEMEVVV